MRLSIAIPALNEEQAVGDTLARTLAARPAIIAAGVEAVEVILVSDGSTDRTVEIARTFEPGVRVEVFERNRGYGAAIKHGFDVATGELVAFMDADGTCDPEQFAPQVRKLLEENADICCGSRMGPDSQMPGIRRLGNRIFRTIVNCLAGSRLTDVASGMRVIRRSSLPAIYPMPDGLHFTPAMSCRAALDPTLKIVEVPMPYAERVGPSKLGVLRDGLRFLKVICDIGLTYRPLRFLGLPGLLLCLLAFVYGGGLLAGYVQVRSIPEWMIYRMVAVTAFASAGLSLVLTGILAERMVALLNGRPRPHTRLTTTIDRLARPSVTALTALALLAVGLYANRYTIAEYFTERHIYVHWSFVVFGLFSTVLALNLLCFAAMDYLLSLFPEQMGRLRRAAAEPQKGGVAG